MDMMIPGVEGSLNLRHPDACQALLDAAAEAGATVVRGVSDVSLTGGGSPTVGFGVDGRRHELHPSLVVGADGRQSTIRKQAGITLDRQEATSYIAGLLLEGLDGVPDDFDVLAAEGDRYFLLFHQGGGRARAYVCGGLSGRQRFAGQGANASSGRVPSSATPGAQRWPAGVAGQATYGRRHLATSLSTGSCSWATPRAQRPDRGSRAPSPCGAHRAGSCSMAT
jgi:hypothetical protein